MITMTLRPHQNRALDLLKESIRSGKKRPLIQAACGFGKTIVAVRIIAGARAKGNRVTFCVPALSLIDQSFNRLVSNGIDPSEIGVIQGDHNWRRPHAPIQIATPQTLARRQFPICDLVIIDEAHLQFSVYEKWMSDPAMDGKLFIALTATPYSKGLGLIYDDLLKPTTMREMIDNGYLSPFRVWTPSHPDLTGVKTVRGDFAEDDLGEAMSKPKLVADIVANWLEKGPGEKTLCFAVNRAHAKKIHEQFEENGVASAYVDAFTSRDEREDILGKLSTGEIKVIVNIGTMTTGVDADVRCVILARPTKSESLFIQCIGRGLRPVYPDGFDESAATDAERVAAQASVKPWLTIFDHSDTHTRLGMVDDIDHAALSLAKPGKSEADEDEEAPEIALPKECPSCGCLVPPASRECPACGFVRRAACNVEQEDGELAELTRGGKKAPKAKGVKLALIEMGKSEVWGQLRSMQETYNWSDGRTSHKFRDIFGVWPNAVRHDALREPSMQLRAWIRQQSIAYAKGAAGRAAAE